MIHLAFIHDFAAFESAARSRPRAPSRRSATALAGTDRPLVIASGVLGLVGGRPGDRAGPARPGRRTRGSPQPPRPWPWPTRGVRSSVVRLSPTVHGDGDHGFMATLVGIARAKGVSGYIGDGANRWPAVHRLDAARAVPPRGRAGPGRVGAARRRRRGRADCATIAEVIGRHLDLPVVSVAPRARSSTSAGWAGSSASTPGVQRAHPRAARLAADPARPGRRPRGGALLPGPGSRAAPQRSGQLSGRKTAISTRST